MLLAQDRHGLQEHVEILSLLGEGAGVEQGRSIMPGRGWDESLEGDATSDDLSYTLPSLVERCRSCPREADIRVDALDDQFMQSPVRALVPIPLEWDTEGRRHRAKPSDAAQRARRR